MADITTAELPFPGLVKDKPTTYKEQVAQSIQDDEESQLFTDTPETAEQTEQKKTLKEKSAAFMQEFVKTINPLDKSWGWKILAGGNAGLTALLAVTTGGTGVIAKSMIEGAALAGFQFLQKRSYDKKERALKAEYTDGQELAQKIVEMREKHEKGVQKVANICSALATGSLVGSYVGLGINLFDKSHVVANAISDTTSKVAGLDATHVQGFVQDKAADAGNLITEQSQSLRETTIGQRAESYIRDNIATTTEATKHEIDFAKNTINDIREKIDQTKQTAENVATTVHDVQQTAQDVQNALPPEVKNHAEDVIMLTPYGRLYRLAKLLHLVS